jgi:hypothetical protein
MLTSFPPRLHSYFNSGMMLQHNVPNKVRSS